MTQINLLPWREKKRERERNFFIILLLSSVLSGLFVISAVNYHWSHLINNQRNRNRILEKEIKIFDEQIKEVQSLEKTKEGLISKISAIRDLQGTRPLLVHLFDELTKVVSAEIYLTKIEGKNTVLSLSGHAKSSAFVSDIMKNIERSRWLHNPQLHEIKKVKGKKYSVHQEFKLTCNLDRRPY